MRYTLWDGNDTDIDGGGVVTHTHPVSGDPAFVAPSDHDYHLTIDSAAGDAGDPAGVPPAPKLDPDGITRPHGMAVDISAYEWQGYYQYLPLVAKTPFLRTGWAIGQDENNAAAIVHTDDGGLDWERQGDSTAWKGLSGNDISAVDDQTAWAALGGSVGGEGAILHTTELWTDVLVILAAMPPAILGPIYLKRYGGDASVASALLLSATLVSAITLFNCFFVDHVKVGD